MWREILETQLFLLELAEREDAIIAAKLLI